MSYRPAASRTSPEGPKPQPDTGSEPSTCSARLWNGPDLKWIRELCNNTSACGSPRNAISKTSGSGLSMRTSASTTCLKSEQPTSIRSLSLSLLREPVLDVKLQLPQAPGQRQASLMSTQQPFKRGLRAPTPDRCAWPERSTPTRKALQAAGLACRPRESLATSSVRKGCPATALSESGKSHLNLSKGPLSLTPHEDLSSPLRGFTTTPPQGLTSRLSRPPRRHGSP